MGEKEELQNRLKELEEKERDEKEIEELRKKIKEKEGKKKDGKDKPRGAFAKFFMPRGNEEEILDRIMKI